MAGPRQIPETPTFDAPWLKSAWTQGLQPAPHDTLYKDIGTILSLQEAQANADIKEMEASQRKEILDRKKNRGSTDLAAELQDAIDLGDYTTAAKIKSLGEKSKDPLAKAKDLADLGLYDQANALLQGSGYSGARVKEKAAPDQSLKDLQRQMLEQNLSDKKQKAEDAKKPKKIDPFDVRGNPYLTKEEKENILRKQAELLIAESGVAQPSGIQVRQQDSPVIERTLKNGQKVKVKQVAPGQYVRVE